MDTPPGSVPLLRSRERPLRTLQKPLAAKEATHVAGERVEPAKRKRGNNQYGNIGIPKCDRCRRLKSRCEYKNAGDKCEKCLLRGKNCSEKLLAKDSTGDDRLELNRNLPAPEQVPERWNIGDNILPRVLEQFDPEIDPARIEEKLYSELEESKRERLSREMMEDEQDRGDEDEDDRSDVNTVEPIDEDIFAMAYNFGSPVPFIESPQRNFSRTSTPSRIPAKENRMDIHGRSHLPPQPLTNVSQGPPSNHGQRVRFAAQPTYSSPTFQPPSPASSAQASFTRQPSRLYAPMVVEQNPTSNFTNPDPPRVRPAGTIAPRDMEIAAQFPGLSVSVPGAPRYPAAARLGGDIARPPGNSQSVQPQPAMMPNHRPSFQQAPQRDWGFDTNMDIDFQDEYFNYLLSRPPQ